MSGPASSISACAVVCSDGGRIEPLGTQCEGNRRRAPLVRSQGRRASEMRATHGTCLSEKMIGAGARILAAGSQRLMQRRFDARRSDVGTGCHAPAVAYAGERREVLTGDFHDRRRVSSSAPSGIELSQIRLERERIVVVGPAARPTGHRVRRRLLDLAGMGDMPIFHARDDRQRQGGVQGRSCDGVGGRVYGGAAADVADMPNNLAAPDRRRVGSGEGWRWSKTLPRADPDHALRGDRGRTRIRCRLRCRTRSTWGRARRRLHYSTSLEQLDRTPAQYRSVNVRAFTADRPGAARAASWRADGRAATAAGL